MNVQAEEPDEMPVTSDPVKGLEAYDRWIAGFMKRHGIPGGQLAVAKAGKVIYSRGFGYADRENQEPVAPTSLFRIASVSKPITAVAVLMLVERGKLKLDDKIDELLKIEPHLEKDATPDERWRKITIAHCLAHIGGWDRDKSFDPMFAQIAAARSLGAKLPISTAELIRYLRGKPLDFAPGERYAYSNFGYCLLGRVIDQVSGQPYETFVQKEVFAPLGITAPRIGRSLVEDRAEREVTYYTVEAEEVMPIVGPHAGDKKHKVLVQYGGWQQEALDAHGGWIASCEDLVRFASGLDKVDKPLLKADSLRDMFARHTPEGSSPYGYGWVLGDEGDPEKPLRAHGGALPCTAATLVKLHDGINVAALFNLGKSRSGDWLGRGLDGMVIEHAEAVRKV